MLKFLYFFCFFSLAQALSAQVEARVHQVFEVKNATKVAIKIDDSKYEVNIKESYSTVIVVEAIIMLDNASPQDIENVIRTGRYNVEMKSKNGVITFTSPENKTPVVLNGQNAEEYVTYNISVPEYMEY